MMYLFKMLFSSKENRLKLKQIRKRKKLQEAINLLNDELDKKVVAGVYMPIPGDEKLIDVLVMNKEE